MTVFQIVQMDPAAAKWIGFAKQQCNRIIDNGTKDFYREWVLEGSTIKAKSYGGSVKLWLVAGGVTDYVGVAMPNPVPYRGVSIGVVQTGTYTGTTYVMASDGMVLASEVQVEVPNNYIACLEETALYARVSSWSGADRLWMYLANNYPPTNTFNHELVFTVPEDCVYPTPAATPPTYYGTDGLGTQWQAYWAAGVTAFNARRKAWFLKNSTEFIAALKGKFQPGAAGVTRAELQTGSIPASWDYQIKTQISKNYAAATLADGSHPGRHTKMPIVMSITSAADVVTSDTSAGLTQAGTMVTKRTTTFAYTDADGTAWSVEIDGTLTQVVTEYTSSGSPIRAWVNTYSNWYNITSIPPNFIEVKRPFWQDNPNYGFGVVLNGQDQGFINVAQYKYYKDSRYAGIAGTVMSAITAASFTPPYPAYFNTVISTSPDIFLQYHNTVLPTYVADTAQSSTVMNNSAMYHVKQVELRLFGPAPGGVAIGIFADPTDADGATQIAYYGKALLTFDWTTGSITVSKWTPQQDANGNDAPKIINLPTGYSYKNQSGTLYFNNGTTNYTAAYNCAIGYVWGSQGSMWPDVAEYWKAKNAQLKAGTFDQVLYTVMQGKQIVPPP